MLTQVNLKQVWDFRAPVCTLHIKEPSTVSKFRHTDSLHLQMSRHQVLLLPTLTPSINPVAFNLLLWLYDRTSHLAAHQLQQTSYNESQVVEHYDQTTYV